MKKFELTFSPYKLKLLKPFQTIKGIIEERKGFLIYLKGDSGKYGTGDCAPLPEYGSESFEEDEEALKKLKLNIKIDFNNIEAGIVESLSTLEKFPALHHGFEQALLTYISKKKNLSLNEILNQHSKKNIKVNGLIGLLPPDDCVVEANKLLKQGFETIKLKAGRKVFKEDLECIAAVQNAADNAVNPACPPVPLGIGRLRIDVNGKWSLSEAIDNLNELKSFPRKYLENIEYVEQPVNSLKDFIELRTHTSIPLAADESIRSIEDAEEFIRNKAVSVLILKPMMLGGLITVLRIIKIAEQNNMKVVITHSFESIVGRSMAVFAASTLKEDLACGLDTDNFFEKDLYPNPYPVKNGYISIGNT